MSVYIRAMPGNIIWHSISGGGLLGQNASGEGMCDDAVVAFKQADTSAYEAGEKERPSAQVLDSDMVSDRKPVPEKTVPYALYHDLILHADLRSMPQPACDEAVAAVYAIHIHLTAARILKMPYAVVHGIEQALSVKGAALEYDCGPNHGT